MDVFALFVSQPYTFLTISRGTVEGDVITAQTEATGVFKLRTGFTKGDTAETSTSDASLHVRPSESFISANNGNLVGHGIVAEGKSYEVVGQTGGKNFDTGVLEHITLTLQLAEFNDDSSS